MALAIEATTTSTKDRIVELEIQIDGIYSQLGLCDSEMLVDLKKKLAGLKAELDIEYDVLAAVKSQQQATDEAAAAESARRFEINQKQQNTKRRTRASNAAYEFQEYLESAVEAFDRYGESAAIDERVVGALYTTLANHFPCLNLQKHSTRKDALGDYSFPAQLRIEKYKGRDRSKGKTNATAK